MRSLLLGALLLAPLLAGCFQDVPEARAVLPADVGYDPSLIEVHGTRLVEATIRSWDGATDLAALIQSPLSNDTLPDGSPLRWPVVVFLHGWGGGKESFAGGRGGVPGSEEAPGVDRLAAFAQAGFIAVAYDARGFGESGGNADVAGPATQADLGSILDWVTAHYPTNGRVGVLGQSYGGGQAYLAWAKDPRITTAVPMYGWVDLADALVPNRVPKLEWAQFLYGYGLVGSHGRYDPMIHDWYTRLYTRTDLGEMEAQMDERSALPRMAVDKPLLVCQGLQETLFPQADLAWEAAGGFTRAYVYTGGHSGNDEGCWSRTLDWFHFFLAGHDTRVDSWPLLETVDATSATAQSYATIPTTRTVRYHLRSPDLVEAPATSTFEVRQSPSSLAGQPSAISDLMGGGPRPMPEALRNDPAAVTFTTPAFEKEEVLFGASTLRLQVVKAPSQFQVAAAMFLVHPDGSGQAIGHAAFAALDPADVDAGTLEMRMEWTHARVQAGDRLELKVAANDPGFWMPLLADYTVTFDGASALDLPFVA